LPIFSASAASRTEYEILPLLPPAVLLISPTHLVGRDVPLSAFLERHPACYLNSPLHPVGVARLYRVATIECPWHFKGVVVWRPPR